MGNKSSSSKKKKQELEYAKKFEENEKKFKDIPDEDQWLKTDIDEGQEIEEIYNDPRMVKLANDMSIPDEKQIEMLAKMENIIARERAIKRKEAMIKQKEDEIKELE